MNHQPHIVIINITQCYACQRPLLPREGVQRRRLLTGDTVGRARSLFPFVWCKTVAAHFQWVSLCQACTAAYDERVHAEQVHNGRKFAFWFGSLIMITYGCALGLPWWAGLTLVAVSTYFQLLWGVILAGFSVS